ncbi:MAG: hypothetical protein P4L53_08985 [Candidatus Obscuribacterales bacterium]|nr:hypothetical protein [Candidatus Obscuribacterales bacterium]
MTFSLSAGSKAVITLLASLQINAGFISPVYAHEESEGEKHLQESYRLTKAGEDEEALVEADKGLKVDQGPTMLRRKAECLLNLGKANDALVEAKKAVKLSPDNADTHMLLATVYDALKMDGDAANELTIAIAKRPADRGFRLWRAKLYQRHQEFAKAAEDLTVVINNTAIQNRSKPLEQRGTCYLLLKDYQKAIADFTSALANSYGRSSLLRQRAEAYEKLGNHVAAKKDIQAAGTMDEAFEPPSTLGVNK